MGKPMKILPIRKSDRITQPPFVYLRVGGSGVREIIGSASGVSGIPPVNPHCVSVTDGINNALYIFGGLRQITRKDDPLRLAADFYKLDLTTMKWTDLTNTVHYESSTKIPFADDLRDEYEVGGRSTPLDTEALQVRNSKRDRDQRTPPLPTFICASGCIVHIKGISYLLIMGGFIPHTDGQFQAPKFSNDSRYPSQPPFLCINLTDYTWRRIMLNLDVLSHGQEKTVKNRLRATIVVAKHFLCVFGGQVRCEKKFDGKRKKTAIGNGDEDDELILYSTYAMADLIHGKWIAVDTHIPYEPEPEEPEDYEGVGYNLSAMVLKGGANVLLFTGESLLNVPKHHTFYLFSPLAQTFQQHKILRNESVYPVGSPYTISPFLTGIISSSHAVNSDQSSLTTSPSREDICIMCCWKTHDDTTYEDDGPEAGVPQTIQTIINQEVIHHSESRSRDVQIWRLSAILEEREPLTPSHEDLTTTREIKEDGSMAASKYTHFRWDLVSSTFDNPVSGDKITDDEVYALLKQENDFCLKSKFHAYASMLLETPSPPSLLTPIKLGRGRPRKDDINKISAANEDQVLERPTTVMNLIILGSSLATESRKLWNAYVPVKIPAPLTEADEGCRTAPQASRSGQGRQQSLRS